MPDTVDLTDLNRRILPPFLVPGAAYYVTGEDKLRIAIANTLAGLTLSIRGRFCQLNGTITPFLVDVTPTSDGVTGNTDIMLGEGWLMNVEVIVTAGAPTATQTFVSMLLVRGDSAAAFEIAVINQGFATATNRVFWPWSQQVVSSSTSSTNPLAKFVAGTVPAAGAVFTDAVPAGKFWEIRAIAFQLVTDGNAGNRGVLVEVTTAAGIIIFATTVEFSQTAAQTKKYTAANSGYNTTGPDARLGLMRQAFPNLVVPAGGKITGFCENIQVGDQFSNIVYNVLETTIV